MFFSGLSASRCSVTEFLMSSCFIVCLGVRTTVMLSQNLRMSTTGILIFDWDTLTLECHVQVTVCMKRLHVETMDGQF